MRPTDLERMSIESITLMLFSKRASRASLNAELVAMRGQIVEKRIQTRLLYSLADTHFHCVDTTDEQIDNIEAYLRATGNDPDDLIHKIVAPVLDPTGESFDEQLEAAGISYTSDLRGMNAFYREVQDNLSDSSSGIGNSDAETSDSDNTKTGEVEMGKAGEVEMGKVAAVRDVVKGA